MEVNYLDIDIAYFIALMHKAGEAVMGIYTQDITVTYKADASPLTEADSLANQIIIAGILEASPASHIISEETRQTPYEERQHWHTCWLIDPIDGTKEFIKKNGQFTLNIALIDAGEPVFGMVYAPAMDVLYYGIKGNGSYIIQQGTTTALPLPDSTDDVMRVVASSSHLNSETQAYLDNLRQTTNRPIEIVSLGSSLKICMVAAGTAHIYPRFGPTTEWDTAAAHAVARYAGKDVYHAQSDLPIIYNKADLLNPHFIVR
jgi:3'(2'), 5'-bisphosphate nucleotidase